MTATNTVHKSMPFWNLPWCDFASNKSPVRKSSNWRDSTCQVENWREAMSVLFMTCLRT